MVETLAHPEVELPLSPANAQAASDLLSPVDASSPRTLLRDFKERTAAFYNTAKTGFSQYIQSDNLYPTAQQLVWLQSLIRDSASLTEVLDLSDLPADARSQEFAVRRIMMFKEILDRIELPEEAAIPDSAMVAESGINSWEIPGTNLYLTRTNDGPTEGQWQLSKESVDRLPSSYHRIKHLPYQPGSTPDLYGAYKYGFTGLYNIIPLRWLFAMPPWTRVLFLDQPLWRWMGLLILIGLFALIVLAISHPIRKLSRARQSHALTCWLRALRPLLLLVFLLFLRGAVSEKLRFTEPVYLPLMSGVGIVIYLSLIWLVWNLAAAVIETIIAAREMRRWSIDSQLMRLSIRFLALITSAVILIEGAQRLGLPAYSIVTGLGVGGLAVALAGREALANLLGSFVIMVEKPFRIGHWVRVGEYEGIVEEVGFRSTRIRTFADSLVTIPSSKVMETVVDNLGLRRVRRIKSFLYLDPATPESELKSYLDAVAAMIREHPHFADDYDQHIVLHDLKDSLLEVMLYFFVRVENWKEELLTRQEILHEVRVMAEKRGIQFAYPTRRVLMEKRSDDPAPAE